MNEIIWKDEEFMKRTRLRLSKMNKENKGRRIGGK